MKASESVMYRTLLSVSLVLVAAATHAGQNPSATPMVSCHVSSSQGERTYELRRVVSGSAPSWTLVMRGHGADVVLPLPGAEPVIGPHTARLAYRSANGGRTVDLDVSSAASAISVWADHGLEVNVDPDLDPRVDEMTIDRTAAQCEVVTPPSATAPTAPK
jgi:hypothetical protein